MELSGRFGVDLFLSRLQCSYLGDVAQLGEHRLCKAGVEGSIPVVSIAPGSARLRDAGDRVVTQFQNRRIFEEQVTCGSGAGPLTYDLWPANAKRSSLRLVVWQREEGIPVDKIVEDPVLR